MASQANSDIGNFDYYNTFIGIVKIILLDVSTAQVINKIAPNYPKRKDKSDRIAKYLDRPLV